MQHKGPRDAESIEYSYVDANELVLASVNTNINNIAYTAGEGDENTCVSIGTRSVSSSIYVQLTLAIVLVNISH